MIINHFTLNNVKIYVIHQFNFKITSIGTPNNYFVNNIIIYTLNIQLNTFFKFELILLYFVYTFTV